MTTLLTKFGLLSYGNLYNLGDEVQSLAARKFLPNLDYYIDRDAGTITLAESGLLENKEESTTTREESGLLENKEESTTTREESGLSENKETAISLPKGEKIRVIYNGWFDGNYTKFPPPPEVEPLFISFHINEVDHSKDKRYDSIDGDKRKFKSLATYTDYLKQYEPIGCRDYRTVELLTNQGVKAYFSGCLTMTLERTTTLKTDKILVVDAHIDTPDLFERLIPKHIRDKAVYISQALQEKTSVATKFRLAAEHLVFLQEADVIITSRLHSTLPPLGFNTDVIMLTEDPDDPRYKGVDKYITILTPDSKPITSLDECRKPRHPEFQTFADTLRARVTSWVHLPTEIKNGYSIFTACMNRNNNLEKALPTWLAAKPDEIVIVDWNSKPPIKPIIDKYNAIDMATGGKGRIKLITVTNINKWVLTWAFNLAARFTSYSRIFKVDCDTMLNPNFFLYHFLDKEEVFFAGDWRKARNRNENFINGIVYMKRVDFFKAIGYDEGIITYGWDDCGLYDRLTKFLTRLNINLDTLSHIEHDDSLRIANQDLEHGKRLDIEIERNRLLSELNLWDGTFSHFIITKSSINEYQAVYVASIIIDQEIRDKMMAQALKNREYATRQKVITQN